MRFQPQMRFSGELSMRLIHAHRAPWQWLLRQWTRWDFWCGLFCALLARLFSKLTRIPTLVGSLRVHLIRADGSVVNYGLLSRRLVTDAFVEFMVDELQAETVEWGDFKYHDCGTGVVAANVADVGLGIPYGGARAVGTQVEGATAEIYRSVGTVVFVAGFAITEHGLFNNAAGITLMDRHVFAAINVINGDSIQFTYELTCNSGG